MHQTIYQMAITTERQLLPAKAARGWEAEQAHPDSSFLRTVLGRAARARNLLRVVQIRAIHLPSQSDVSHQVGTTRLIDVLPTE